MHQEMKRCKAIVLCATLDLPAKAKVQNVIQFNGEFGCSSCKQPGKVVPVGAGNTRVYEYLVPASPLKTHQECFTIGKKALETGQVLVIIFSMTKCVP